MTIKNKINKINLHIYMILVKNNKTYITFVTLTTLFSAENFLLGICDEFETLFVSAH